MRATEILLDKSCLPRKHGADTHGTQRRFDTGWDLQSKLFPASCSRQAAHKGWGRPGRWRHHCPGKAAGQRELCGQPCLCPRWTDPWVAGCCVQAEAVRGLQREWVPLSSELGKMLSRVQARCSTRVEETGLGDGCPDEGTSPLKVQRSRPHSACRSLLKG